MRLKVQINDPNASNTNSYRKSPATPLKFLYIVPQPALKTIGELRHLLEQYLVRQFSIKNVRIVQLLTDDGYILPDDTICLNVLQDNDRIICYDMEKFVQENYSTLDLENLWCEIKQYDARDNLEKSIQVGLNNLEKLFIRMYGTSNSYALYMFNVFDLVKIANEKKRNNTIARLDDANWFIESKWEYDSSSDTMLFLICTLKVASSEQIWSNKLCLLLDESRMCIGKGKVTSLSGEASDDAVLTEQQRKRLKEFASQISPPKRIGPEIDVDKDVNKKITKHECEGESLVRMAYGSTNTVTTHQDSRCSEDGTFRQHFVITHINFSKKPNDIPSESHLNNTTAIDKPLSVINLTVFYQNNDGSWDECHDIAIASIALRDEEPRWLADLAINLEPDKLLSYVIKGWINVKGQPGRDNATRKRIHKNLPQPLKLKIVTMDNFNRQSSLIVEQLNKPLEYDTFESYRKYNQSSINNLLAFVYADDCEYDERFFMAIYLNKEHQLVIHSGHSYSITLDRKNIRSMEYNAKQNQTSEVPFESIYYQYDGQERKAIALFDCDTFMFYAVRLELSTRTSKTEQTVLLPVEQI